VLISRDGRSVGSRQIRRELIELELPELPVAFDPGRRLPHRRGDEGSTTDATLLLDAREPRALEHADVLGYRGEAHVEPRRELADRPVTGGEASENRAPRRIGERAEGGVESRLLVNHMVYYCTVGVWRARGSLELLWARWPTRGDELLSRWGPPLRA